MTNLSGENLNNGAAVGPQGEDMDSPSTFPAYLAYKDSGVEWLGSVPESWSVASLRFFADLITGITPPSDDLSNYAEEGWSWVRPEDLDDSGKQVLASKFLTDQGWNFCRKVKSQSTLICCIGTIGKLGFIEADFCTNQQITAVVPRQGGRFYFYAMHALKPAFDAYATGNVIRILNSERLGSVALAVPSKNEAESIARFLDHETACIDALIEEQQRLIELLKEKRHAVISQAVTKGLDSTVPMKDSGVEWLGEVPAHWDVLRIGAVYSEAVEKGLAELPVLRVSIHYGVSDRELTEEESDRKITRIDDREKYKRVRPGDLVYNMMRAWQGGFGAVLVDGLVSPAYVVARPISVDISRYVEQLLRTGCAVEEMRKNSYGITDFRLRLYWDQFKNIAIAVPPEPERQQIMLRIDSLISESDALRDEADILINILQERRSALISAAVTGKIDVRGWQPPASVQAPESEVAEAV